MTMPEQDAKHPARRRGERGALSALDVLIIAATLALLVAVARLELPTFAGKSTPPPTPPAGSAPSPG